MRARKFFASRITARTAALIAEELVERGFEVRAAHNGQEGLLANTERKPNLVLCDISMPITSGFEVLERLTGIAPLAIGRGFPPPMEPPASQNSEVRRV